MVVLVTMGTMVLTGMLHMDQGVEVVVEQLAAPEATAVALVQAVAGIMAQLSQASSPSPTLLPLAVAS